MASGLCPYCMQVADGDICPHCGKDVNYPGSSAHLPAGYVVSGKHPYVLGAALGQGGFGITYIALDMITGQRVAIKEYFPIYCSSRTNGTVSAYPKQEEVYKKGRDRFLDEARTLKSLSDLPNIVNVLDFFELNNTAYLVMEFLEGSSLKEHAIKNGVFPAQAFLKQIRPLMEDIQKMHDRGVIHRDIAPDNIIRLPDGQLKLIDFGAARSYIGDQSMTVVVKKGFAPVEQYFSSGSVPATDVYALAATIYYCITGKVPMESTERQIQEIPLDLPTSLGADISLDQEAVLFKALEILPKARTQSMQQFLEALVKATPDPVVNSYTRLSLPKGYILRGNSHTYELQSVLSHVQGCMIYSARNRATGAEVAVREFLPEHQVTRNAQFQVIPRRNCERYYRTDKDQFLKDAWELKQLTSLKHFVRILDYFEAKNTVYMVTEPLPLSSTTLRHQVEKRGPFPAQSFLKMIQPLAEDLHQMHRKGIIHPNISPDNIVLLPTGQLKFTGLSDNYDSYWTVINDDPLDFFAMCFQAPEELSTEQQSASVLRTANANVYSLAATIYYCITGQLPEFSLKNQNSLPLQLPIAMRADITPAQESALLRALALKKETRTGSMQAFLTDLNRKSPQQLTAAEAEDARKILEVLKAEQARKEAQARKEEEAKKEENSKKTAEKLPVWICPNCGSSNTGTKCALCGHITGNNPSKRKKLIAAVSLILLLVIGYFTVHFYTAPTCTRGSVCEICGKAGDKPALGHDWAPATCTEPKTCKRCNTILGKAAGHEWQAPTCTEDELCLRCGITGDKAALGHMWVDTANDDPRICSICNETEITMRKISEWRHMRATSSSPDKLVDGAALDEHGNIWYWGKDTPAVKLTSVSKVKALAQSFWGYRIYFLKEDGTVGYINNDKNGITDRAVMIRMPEKIIHITVGQRITEVYAIGKSGKLYKYQLGTSKAEQITAVPQLEDLQHIGSGETGTFFARATDGSFYGWGENVFGCFCDSKKEVLDQPVKLDLDPDLYDIRVFCTPGEKDIFYACTDNARTINIIDNKATTVATIEECSIAFAKNTAFYAITTNGDLYAYGKYASNVELYYGTKGIFDKSKLPYVAKGLGADIDTIGIGGWDVTFIMKDRSIRTWGQAKKDHMVQESPEKIFYLP